MSFQVGLQQLIHLVQQLQKRNLICKLLKGKLFTQNSQICPDWAQQMGWRKTFRKWFKCKVLILKLCQLSLVGHHPRSSIFVSIDNWIKNAYIRITFANSRFNWRWIDFGIRKISPHQINVDIFIKGLMTRLQFFYIIGFKKKTHWIDFFLNNHKMFEVMPTFTYVLLEAFSFLTVHK